MSRQTELVKNTAILTFGKICTQFVQFLLLPLYTALLVPEEFGVVDVFNTYVTLLVPLFNWQFENGLFRFMLDCREDEKRQKVIFSTVILANAAQAALYLAFFAAAQGWIHSEYKVFLAVDVVANIFLNTLLQMSRGIGKNSIYAVGSFLSVSSTVALNVVFIVGLRMGAMGMFLATAISKGITIVYLTFAQRVWRYFSVRSFGRDEFKQIFRYSVPLVPNALSWWVINASNRSVISNVLGLAANGIFAAANKFSSIYITVYNVFNMAWTESVSVHMNDADRDSFLKETINAVFRLFASACLMLIAVMPFVFPLMVNAQYAGAYVQIPILMIAVLFQVVQGLYSVVYVALKKSKEIAKTSMYAAAINLIVDVLLIKFIGLYAASAATLVAYASMAIYRYFDIRRYVRAELEMKSILSTIAMGAVVIVSYYINSVYSNIAVALATFVYCVAVNRSMLRTIVKAVLGKARPQKPVVRPVSAEAVQDGKKPLPRLYESKDDCCGCAACACICPADAISMKPDGEGFNYPEVDGGKCVRCYRCLTVCAFKEDRAARNGQ